MKRFSRFMAMRPCNTFKIVSFVLGLALLSVPVRGGDVSATRHNLSASGPGDLKASGESRICVFCHTPHFADPAIPLWNHSVDEGVVYDLYASSTLDASPSQPDGPSRLCLSCHDGTIALGQLGTGSVTFDGGVTVIPDRSTNLATDLDDDHPIGIRYDDTLSVNDGQLRFPGDLPPGVELRYGVLHCTSCHDPHDDSFGSFLTMSNDRSELCVACHQITNWPLSSHSEHNVLCQDCHMPHTADQPDRLLRGAVEEDTCTTNCHNGSGPGRNVLTVFNWFSRHPVEDTQGVHDPAEDPRAANYHVECVDCHNPHQANDDHAMIEGGVTGYTTGVKGVDLSGNVVDQASYEYEICFKCHADNSVISLVSVPRQVEDVNMSNRFDTNNPSYHPVTGPGKSFDVPSLRPGLTAGATRIYCSDCHNTSNGSRAGGFGPNGVHGSSFPAMLAKNYWFERVGAVGPDWKRPYVESDAALCWQCHDPTLLMVVNGFHDKHVSGQQTPCYLCHDPHGVKSIGPGNQRLINFTTLFGFTASFDGNGCTSSCHTSGGYRLAE